MKSSVFKLLLAGLALCAFNGEARADYVVWQDAKTGVSLSYPDDWKPVNNQQPDDRLTVALPSGEDHAQCRVRVNEEGRHLIYPQRFREDILKTDFAAQFWDDYTANYQGTKIHDMTDGASLGRSYASMITASYMTAPDDPQEFRMGVMAVSPYYDQVFLVDCSSTAESFGAYKDIFMSFMKSINFQKTFHELTIGDYPRDFLTPRSTIIVPHQNAVSATTY